MDVKKVSVCIFNKKCAILGTYKALQIAIRIELHSIWNNPNICIFATELLIHHL